MTKLAEPRALVRAAGGLVYRRSPERWYEVLLIHRPRYDDWSFPKGKADKGETYERCALREVREETGLKCKLEGELAGTTYFARNGKPKIVRYWAMRATGGTFKPNSEVDRVAWLAIPDALARLTYEHDREVLESLIEAKVTSPIIVLRHAAAGDRLAWDRPDSERPLTKKGRRQADALVELYRPFQIERVISSPYVRCLQTVEPLAASIGVEIEERAELAEGARGVGRLMGEIEGEAVVLCTHGDIIWDVMGAVEAKKASSWVLTPSKKGFKTVGYLPPPQV